MRTAAALVTLVIGAAACGPGPGVDPSQYAGLPPQDTLVGGLAPAPSTATGGGAATPVNPSQPPATGGDALTRASTPPAPGVGAGTAPAGTGTAGTAAAGPAAAPAPVSVKR